jgi:hypothetical protein
MADLIRKLNIENARNPKRLPGQSVKDYKEKNNGVYHTHLTEPVTQYNRAESEKIIQQNNSFIIMGRDRPMGITSGYGAQPEMGNSACIDIIAGPTGIQAKETINEAAISGLSSDRQKQIRVTTDKDPSRDAARIYISQRADIDDPKWFNLPDGTIGSIKTRSAILLKADSIRIVSRDGGIKLVAGGRDTYNAQGVPIKWAQGINLIGGDGETPCQPIVKGDNLVKCLLDMNRSIKDLFGMINIIQKALVDFHFNYATHTHPVDATKALAFPALQAALMSKTNHIKLAAKSSSLAFNIGRTQSQYLSEQGGEKNYINSFRNHAN